MTLSLRARLLVFVAVINTAVFGLGFFALSRLVERDRFTQSREAMHDLLSTLPPSLDLGGEQFVPQLLRWSRWGRFQDAILVHARIERSSKGELQPRGVFLNLRGRRVRPPGFDQQALLAVVQRSIAERSALPALNGVVLPVLDARGQVWGACWYVPEEPDTRVVIGSLLGLFVLSTLLLIVVTFAALRRFVLEPVDTLAQGARELSRGVFATRLVLPERRDEFSELMRGFNQMAETVEGFNARLAREVEVATENARRAEHVAMTQRRLAATGELAAGIAHEINNPLGGLLNATETLARPDLGPEKRAQYVELVKQGLERIRRTVGQLLRFTPRAPGTAPLALVDPLLDAVGLVSYRARSAGVRLELNGVDLLGPQREAPAERLRALPRVQGDQPELAQAVLNLLVNALDALEEARTPAPRIALSIRVEPGVLVLGVEDNGPGIPPELLPRVLDLFFTTKEVGKGSGLGLSIVHNVASAHGATLQLARASLGGLSVELRFPLSPTGTPGPPWPPGQAGSRA